MIAWFIVPYKRDLTQSKPTRYCAMDDFTTDIYGEGGKWSETEILGNVAIVKVNASSSLITTINQAPTFFRLPTKLLSEFLSDLTTNQKNALVNKLNGLGYTNQEIQNALGSNIGTKTFGDLLRFAATRRLKPQYNPLTDTITIDGEVQSCKSIDVLDTEVT